MTYKNIFSIRFLKEPLAHRWFQVLLYIINNTTKRQSFDFTLLNDQTVLFETIQFSMNQPI